MVQRDTRIGSQCHGNLCGKEYQPSNHPTIPSTHRFIQQRNRQLHRAPSSIYRHSILSATSEIWLSDRRRPSFFSFSERTADSTNPSTSIWFDRRRGELEVSERGRMFPLIRMAKLSMAVHPRGIYHHIDTLPDQTPFAVMICFVGVGSCACARAHSIPSA
jgi:hypothetical protein